MRQITLIALSLLACSRAFALETELYGVRLGDNYEATKRLLTKAYGPPVKSSSLPDDTFDEFIFDKNLNDLLVISTRSNFSRYVAQVKITGSDPVESLHTLGGLNLGLPENYVPRDFPRVGAPRRLKGGAKQFDIPDSNFSVQSKDSKISAIQIGIDGPTVLVENPRSGTSPALSANQAAILAADIDSKNDHSEGYKQKLIARLQIDRLKEFCSYRHLLYNRDGVYYINLVVETSKGKGSHLKLKDHPATFIFDLGTHYSTITPEFCKKIGCKIVQKANHGLPMIGTGGVVFAGPRGVKMDLIKVSKNRNSDVRVDGVLGWDVIFAYDLFVDLRDEYLCYPTDKVGQVSDRLGMRSVSARYDDGLSAPMSINQKTVGGLYLSTAIAGTNIPKTILSEFKVPELPDTRDIPTYDGDFTAKTYGPVTVGFAGTPPDYSRTFPSIGESPTAELHEVGSDYLRAFIFGLDRPDGRLYLMLY